MHSDQHEKLAQLLKESFSVSLAGLSDSQPLMEMDEWDSLSHMQFITTLEGEFGFELTGDEIADMQSIGDIKRVVSAKTQPAAS